MPQPQITGTPPVLKFGSVALPNGQGTMTQVNLNDLTSWFWMDWPAGAADTDYIQLSIGQLAWRATSTIIGRDRGQRTLTLPMRYLETTVSLGAALATLSEAGLQQLTFDNSTYISAEFAGAKNRTLLRKYSPYYWGLDLIFSCLEPQFRDISSTALSPVAVAIPQVSLPRARTAEAQRATGRMVTQPVTRMVVGRRSLIASSWPRLIGMLASSAASFSITYAGSVFCEPVWTVSIPSTNPAVITSLTLTGSMPSPDETLTAVFPGGLAALTAYTITIDSGAMTITDQLGNSYDNAGNAFPNLYGPPGTINPFSVSMATSSGVPSGVSLAASWNCRWRL